MPLQNNVIMMKRAVPKKVSLQDIRVLYAKFQRVKRANLSPNVRVRRTYRIRQGSKREQHGKGFEWSIKKAVKKINSFRKRAAIFQCSKC